MADVHSNHSGAAYEPESDSSSSGNTDMPEDTATHSDPVDVPVAQVLAAHSIGDMSKAEKIAICDFERGVIANDQDFILYGMCMLCDKMAHPSHYKTERHSDKVAVYNSTLRALLSISSTHRRGRRACIVQFLNDNLMPPVTEHWWHKAAEYLMGDHSVNILFQRNLRQPSPVIPPPSLNCVVCMNGLRRIMFSPCNHVLCCASCSNQVTSCPLCRTPIDSRTVVYLS